MHSETAFTKTILWASLFAIAMALIEADVVIYLRLLYYPNGFALPLYLLPPFTMWVEIGREFGTMVMLLAVANLTGKNFQQRFAWFAFLFGVWDVFYYIWLALQIGWPASLLDWDILFLIPLPWLGPVLAPVLISLCLIGGALTILFFQQSDRSIHLTKWDWLLLVLSGLILIVSFTIDADVLTEHQFPQRFRWEIFIPALLFGCGVFGRAVAISAQEK